MEKINTSKIQDSGEKNGIIIDLVMKMNEMIGKLNRMDEKLNKLYDNVYVWTKTIKEE